MEAGRVELPSENRSTRLSTRLAGLFYLPRDSPNGRIVLWQLFESAGGYRALTRRVGCCVTPRPKPQHSSAGRAALRQLMLNLYDQRLILSCPGFRSSGGLRVLNEFPDPRRNLYAPGRGTRGSIRAVPCFNWDGLCLAAVISCG